MYGSTVVCHLPDTVSPFIRLIREEFCFMNVIYVPKMYVALYKCTQNLKTTFCFEMSACNRKQTVSVCVCVCVYVCVCVRARARVKGSLLGSFLVSFLLYLIVRNLISLVSWLGGGIAQWYSAGLRAGLSGVLVPAGAGNFSLHHRVQTGSGPHPDPCPLDTRGSFPEGEEVREAHHSPPYSAGVKNAWNYTSTSQYVVMVWYVITGKTLLIPYLYWDRNFKSRGQSCSNVLKSLGIGMEKIR
jgi:hypothetical protein